MCGRATSASVRNINKEPMGCDAQLEARQTERGNVRKKCEGKNVREVIVSGENVRGMSRREYSLGNVRENIREVIVSG